MNGALKGLQFILGVLLGLMGLGAIAGGIGYYFFITQLSTRPPKPIFAEERKVAKPAAKKTVKNKTAIAATPNPSAEKDSNKTEKLPSEAYNAKVVWKDGLSLKKEPNAGSEKVGGAAYNEKVSIVKESEDKQWLLIRTENSNAEGWVKAGNIDKSGNTELENPTESALKPTPKPKLVKKTNIKPKPVKTPAEEEQ